jgi:hypothetical protein
MFAPNRFFHLVTAATTVVLFCTATAPGEILYVDNLQGSDAFNGTSPLPLDADSGPVRTIGRALALALPGTTIQVMNNGMPYFESFTITGARLRGFTQTPLTIEGNGAVVSGARSLPPRAWDPAGGDVWRLKFQRKGHYQLLLEGRPVPEFLPETPPGRRGEIPEGHYYAERGVVYYKSPPLTEPLSRPFQFGYEEVGLTLYQTENVLIRNITFQHYRLDGINAHGLCRNVTLENVTAVENGRAGVAAGGTSEVWLRGGKIADNRRAQLRISELATVRVDDTDMSEPPTLVE